MTKKQPGIPGYYDHQHSFVVWESLWDARRQWTTMDSSKSGPRTLNTRGSEAAGVPEEPNHSFAAFADYLVDNFFVTRSLYISAIWESNPNRDLVKASSRRTPQITQHPCLEARPLKWLALHNGFHETALSATVTGVWYSWCKQDQPDVFVKTWHRHKYTASLNDTTNTTHTEEAANQRRAAKITKALFDSVSHSCKFTLEQRQ